MAETTETIYTPDGRLHTLLGSTTLASIVRDYAGDDAATMVEKLEDDTRRAESLLHSDLGSYEGALEHWRGVAVDWVEAIDIMLSAAKKRQKTSKQSLIDGMEDLRRRIYNEL